MGRPLTCLRAGSRERRRIEHDRVEPADVELLGFDFAKVGYPAFCAKAGLGQSDLASIEVLGEKVADHKRSYRPHDNIEQQYRWMTRT